MKNSIYCFSVLFLMGCTSMQPLELSTTIKYEKDTTLEKATGLASTIAGEYTKRSMADYKELVKADQFLLHAAAVGIIGVASSAHADVLTAATLFGGYVGAQKTYAGPLGKAKLYLEAASAAQCVEKHAARLLPVEKKLMNNKPSIVTLESDLSSELSVLNSSIKHLESAYSNLTDNDKSQLNLDYSRVHLGGFSSTNEIYRHGEDVKEKLRNTIHQIEELPFLVIEKLQQIDMEVTRRFITETVDIDTVIATLKQVNKEDEPEDKVEPQQMPAPIGAPKVDGTKSNELQIAVVATEEMLTSAHRVMELTNIYTSIDLSPLTKNANAIKACVVATVQVND